MKKQFTFLVTLVIAMIFVSQMAQAQCFQLGTTIGQLTPSLKTTTNGFCPTPAQISSVCDCPTGYVAVGYEGTEGNVYGAMVLSQFKLRCKQLNTDGTLGNTVTVTCMNGTAAGATVDGPVDAAAGQALVGAEVRIGCAMDAVMGKSKLLSEIQAGGANSTSNTMTGIGGTGGSPVAATYVPNGSVIVGMQTYVEVGTSPAGAAGITAGVAWRYASVLNVACPAVCAINSISVSNISACNNQGTPTTADDTYTANVTVNFAGAPTTGTLNLSGDATASVPVSSLGATSYTFTGVTMSADGGAISLTAAFSAASGCSLTNSNAGTAPNACSVTPPPCAIVSIAAFNLTACNNNGTTSNGTDDTFTASVTVNFVNPPTTGTLNLSGSGSASVPVSSLTGNSYTFTNVTMPANGQPIQLNATFSASASCFLSNNNVATAPASCSTGTPSVPTMSEWGLILFALIIFSMSVVFGTQQQRRMAHQAAGYVAPETSGQTMFDAKVFAKVLPLVYLACAGLFAIATVFGYEMTSADIPGSLLSGAVLAYLIQFVMISNKKDQ